MRSTVLAAFVLLAGLSCAAATCHSVFDVISSSRHLTLIKDVITQRGLQDDLSATDLQITLFAPENSAWLDPELYAQLEQWSMFQGQQLSAETLLTDYPQVVEYILENHIVNQNEDLSSLLETPRLRTLNEQFLLVDAFESNVTGVDVSCEDKLISVQSAGSSGTLLFCGISACTTSTVYVTDVVLLPEEPSPEALNAVTVPAGTLEGMTGRRRLSECVTPYAYLSSNNTYSFFKDMVDAAGLADLLDSPTWEGTVFAPPNGALAGVVTDLGVGMQEFLSKKDVIEAWVRSHTVEGPPMASGLWKEGGSFLTALPGDSLSIVPSASSGEKQYGGSCAGGLALLDSFSKRDAGVDVVHCDMQACKGVVHGIQDVLISSSVEGMLPVFPNHDAARFHDKGADEDWTWESTLTDVSLGELVQ